MAQIHQEIRFDAAPARVFRALTDASEFAKVTGAPARIDATEGGEFQCFGTFILGRTVELVSDQRLVQAWRVFDWEPGVYSIVRFELAPDGDGTKLIFDQDGVPESAVGHIDSGWANKYWDPIKVYLAKG